MCRVINQNLRGHIIHSDELLNPSHLYYLVFCCCSKYLSLITVSNVLVCFACWSSYCKTIAVQYIIGGSLVICWWPARRQEEKKRRCQCPNIPPQASVCACRNMDFVGHSCSNCQYFSVLKKDMLIAATPFEHVYRDGQGGVAIKIRKGK